MTKILLSSNRAWFLNNYLSSQMRSLRNRGYEVVGAGSADGVEDRLTASDVRFIELPIPVNPINPIADIRLFWHFYRIYRRERPGVVHHFTIKPVIYGSIAARLAGVPRIVNTVTGTGYVFSDRAQRWLRIMVELQYRVALACAHVTCFENDEDRTLFIRSRLVRREKTGLLPMGVDIEQFVPRDPDEHLRQSGAVVFLMTARLLIDKGVYEYVEAAARVKAEFPETRFQLLGKRDVHNPGVVPLEDLQKWQDAGVVEYLGEVSDVREVLSNADVMVLPSYYREGAPRSLLEAAAMGKPIITTDSVGCREVVDQGVNGVLVPVKDAPALATAMICMLQDAGRRLDMGRAGREKIVREFDANNVIRQSMEVYQGACAAQVRPIPIGRVPSPNDE